MSNLIAKALIATRELKDIEFKSHFDALSDENWCEIIKDIIAISNSGGGIILFGVDDSGLPTKSDLTELIKTDSADIVNRIAKYIGQQFYEFSIEQHYKDGVQIVMMLIGNSPIPLAFKKPGTYSDGKGGQKLAFREGTVYFRHGPKSEPCNTEDLQKSFDRQLNKVKKSWLKDIGKIIKAPNDTQIVYVPRDLTSDDETHTKTIRITDDPSAPIYGKLDFDLTHPLLRKHIINKLNESLPNRVTVNQHDIIAIRSNLNAEDYPKYCHQSKFGSTQYSADFINLILENYKKDNEYFAKQRLKYSNKSS